MKTYSPFLRTIYNESAPVNPANQIGRGAHYSVFEYPSWHDPEGRAQTSAHLKKIAVIWDEDHDERIIPVLEQLFLEGLLSPLMFIGERKGMLTLIMSPSFWNAMGEKRVGDYHDMVKRISESSDDPWPVDDIAPFGEESNIIQGYADRAQQYLSSIELLWQLG